MNSKELRQEWRRAQAAKVREERIITAYVKAKHPEIYNNAAVFYNKLNEKYPKKYDLRKVKEFKTLLSDNSPKPQKYQEKTFPSITVNAQPTFTDCIQLRIPLLPVEDIVPAATTPVQSPPVATATTPVLPVQSPPVATATTPVLPVQSPPVATTTPEPAQFCTIEKEDLVHFAGIDDDVINQIVADLQNDPFIHTFFEDMEIEELSPLEAELLMW